MGLTKQKININDGGDWGLCHPTSISINKQMDTQTEHSAQELQDTVLRLNLRIHDIERGVMETEGR